MVFFMIRLGQGCQLPEDTLGTPVGRFQLPELCLICGSARKRESHTRVQPKCSMEDCSQVVTFSPSLPASPIKGKCKRSLSELSALNQFSVIHIDLFLPHLFIPFLPPPLAGASSAAMIPLGCGYKDTSHFVFLLVFLRLNLLSVDYGIESE